MTASPIKIGGVETFSTVDFPEKISSVIFMQGCPWQCPFCHNSALQSPHEDSGFIWAKYIEFLQSRRRVLDGVVFSGGEPLMQEGIFLAADEVKNLGFAVGLHTGGAYPQRLKKFLSYADWVGLDIKAPFDPASYARLIGRSGDIFWSRVIQSLDILLEQAVDFECRTTCDPRLLSFEDVRHIAEGLASRGVKKYYLQKYRPIPTDTTTEDAECEKFFRPELIVELKSMFEVFDVRR